MRTQPRRPSVHSLARLSDSTAVRSRAHRTAVCCSRGYANLGADGSTGARGLTAAAPGCGLEAGCPPAACVPRRKVTEIDRENPAASRALRRPPWRHRHLRRGRALGGHPHHADRRQQLRRERVGGLDHSCGNDEVRHDLTRCAAVERGRAADRGRESRWLRRRRSHRPRQPGTAAGTLVHGTAITTIADAAASPIVPADTPVPSAAATGARDCGPRL